MGNASDEFEHQAAIYEYDAGMTRHDAEEMAYLDQYPQTRMFW